MMNSRGTKINNCFKSVGLAVVIMLAAVPFVSSETEVNLTEKLETRETGLYAEFFDKNLYDRATQWLYLDRAYRKIFGKYKPADNVNIFDELPDSSFFTNRHSRRPMSRSELKKGADKNQGPGPGMWTVTKGKVEGRNPGFFIKDSLGNEYLLKFDPPSNPEMASSAEVITSKFFYAIGYNVPQYTIEYFNPENLEVDKSATFYDKDGFKKKLTLKKVHDLLDNVAETEDGQIRASASLLVEGVPKGAFSLHGRRQADPKDLIPHRERREIRALKVFGSWLNHFDLRKSNTLDVVLTENGKQYVKHYLIDFGSTLGSLGFRPMEPNYGFEYLVDYGPIGKALLTFGFWKRRWQERWEKRDKSKMYPAVGYFDNIEFVPGKWKPQLPHFAFDDMTPADAFWAAKIIMSFKDDDIKAIVETGEISNKEAEEYLAETLIERRDIIGRYWFKEISPLDDFRLLRDGDSYRLRFEDLAVKYGFKDLADRTYRYKVKMSDDQVRGFKEVHARDYIDLDMPYKKGDVKISVIMQVSGNENEKWLPPVEISLMYDRNHDEYKITGINREIE